MTQREAGVEVCRVAVVTGATRGIGRATAWALAERGYAAVATGRDAEALEALAAEARRAGLDLDIERIDVCDARSVTRGVDAIARRHEGRIDVLVNNAAIADTGPATSTSLLDTSDEALCAVLDTNLLGALRMARRAAPLMVAQGWGRIVNVSSQRGQLTPPPRDAHDGAYRVSKAALNMLTRLLACELEGTGVLVNAVCPGWVPTRLGGPNATGRMEDAVASILWAVQLPDDGPTGGFFHLGKPLAW